MSGRAGVSANSRSVRRLFVLLLAVYTCLDLSCPLWPGAFTFDPDDSVDGVRAEQSGVDLGLPAGESVAAPHPAATPALPRVARVTRRSWSPSPTPPTQRSHIESRPEAPSGEDH